MATKTNEITTGLQTWLNDLCVVARYLSFEEVCRQLDEIGELMTLFSVEVKVPELPGWRPVMLEEPPQLIEEGSGHVVQ